VMCQWLPIYGMTQDLVASVMATFAKAFPHILVFESVEGFDLLLIGSKRPLLLHPKKMEMRWVSPDLREELAAIGIESGVDLAGRFLMGKEGIRRFSPYAVVNTDDNGYIEYGAPRALHLRTANRNNASLSKASEGIASYLDSDGWGDAEKVRLRKALLHRNELSILESLP